MRHYYAEQSPRGFANEIKTYRFASKADRDAFVEEHKNDGDCNSAACGAEAIDAKTAYANVGYRGDDATESFNSGFIDM
jgi:hypothetical protein